jgi:hypothetical protein
VSVLACLHNLVGKEVREEATFVWDGGTWRVRFAERIGGISNVCELGEKYALQSIPKYYQILTAAALKNAKRIRNFIILLSRSAITTDQNFKALLIRIEIIS